MLICFVISNNCRTFATEISNQLNKQVMKETQLEKMLQIEGYVSNAVAQVINHIEVLISSAIRTEDSNFTKEDEINLRIAYNKFKEAQRELEMSIRTATNKATKI